MRKVNAVRQKQKFVGVVAIGAGFEVFICAGIKGDDDVEPLPAGFLDVESRHPVFDLRNSLVPCQCPMGSIWVDPTNRLNTKRSGSLVRDYVAYAKVSGHWCIPLEHADKDQGLLSPRTEANLYLLTLPELHLGPMC